MAAGRRGRAHFVSQRLWRPATQGFRELSVRVLVTGVTGQVGSALVRSVTPGIELHALTHQQLNIADARAVNSTVAAVRPQLIINAAAYTAVDKAESEPFL